MSPFREIAVLPPQSQNRQGIPRIAEWHLDGIHDGNLCMAARALRKKLCIVSLVWTTAPKTVARQNLSCCPPSGLPVVH